MALPDLIEIVPLDKPVRAEVTVPGSKSITNRALILAALADGGVTLKGALWSEDTQIMVDCLKELGFIVNVAADPDEPCNRTITVIGQGGLIPDGGSESEPKSLFVGNAGTAARFLAPFLCLGNGVYRLHGVKRMHERPQAAMFAALRELGYRIESENGNDKLPARIYAGHAGLPPDTMTQFIQRKSAPVAPKKCKVSIEESSQFASALLLSSKVGNWQIEIVGENADESPYVTMTSKLMEVFPKNGGVFQIEPDASSGSYFLAAGRIIIPAPGFEATDEISILHWSFSRWQIDENFWHFVPLGSLLHPVLEQIKKSDPRNPGSNVQQRLQNQPISRLTDLGDSIMTAIVIAPLLDEPLKFIDLGRLRVQECERVVALRTELTKCGAKVVEEGDTLTVYPAKPGELHGAEIETYNDHRMAMCFAILGLKVPGIKLKNPACVKKTFPNFFQKLAASPPNGLGVTILDGKTGRKLTHEELFAE
jgi:3-phosphoshikimate 1-carboxyvinyltransferase